MKITAIPLRTFSPDYTVDVPGTGACRIERPLLALRHKADIILPGEAFSIRSVGVGPRGYTMKDAQDQVALTAQRSGFWSASFEVKFDDRTLFMKMVRVDPTVDVALLSAATGPDGLIRVHSQTYSMFQNTISSESQMWE